MNVHITGAAGSGTSTLACAVAEASGASWLEADDFYWLPSEPPYRLRRPADERRLLLMDRLSRPHGAVVAGSVNGWGAGVEDAFDLIVFLYVPMHLRLARINDRELRRFGRVDPAFLAWAGQYDEGPPEGRSLARQRAWVAARSCPVLCIEGDTTTDERLRRVLAATTSPQA